ncbi:RidA family protein [Granulosicoccus sp. 3-233]|uniref:RidA family protein n=1 Tax=Granulosicoccus sp. 3-233 TaxID=3417969 RepID=UPI003D32E554
MSATPARLNPTTMPDAGTVGYSQISIADANRLAFVSGQVAWPADGSAVPDTLNGQMSVVLENLQSALSAIDAAPCNIAQMRIYMVDLTSQSLDVAMPMIAAFLDGTQPSLTGVGVAALAAPELLVEIEMVVQMPG